MKFVHRLFAAIALLSAFALPAFADKCKDPIVDEVSAFSSSDLARVEQARNALVASGADVRVHVISSFHRNAEGEMNKSIEAYKDQMLGKCRSWQSADGGMKNNLVLIMVAPKQKKTYLAAGGQWDRALSADRKSQVVDTMNARFRDGKVTDGVVAGLTHMTDLASVKPSQEGKPVTINHAADYSGFSSFLKWALFLTVLGALLFGGFWFYRQHERRRTAQRNAQTERAKCTQSINSYEAPLAVLEAKVKAAEVSTEWRVRLNELLDSAREHYRVAGADYAGLDHSSNNPDTPRLSVEEYENMRLGYVAVARRFASGEEALGKVESELRRAIRGEAIVVAVAPKQAPVAPETPREPERRDPSRNQRPPQGSSRSERRAQRSSRSGAGSGGSSAGTGGTKTVHHHHHHDDGPGFVTGVVVGTVLSDNHHHHDHRDRPSDPVIVQPNFPEERGRSGGSEVSADWGRSSEGSGVEKSWGGSGSGNAVESSWSSSESGGSDRSGTSY